MSCFSYNRGASGYTNAVFQLIFFHISLYVYAEFFYVQMFIFLLLVRIDCVAMKPGPSCPNVG